METIERKKSGFYEDSDGNKSFMRLSISWYFWGVCLPGSLWDLYVFGTSILNDSLTLSDGGMLLGLFLILQLGWIAPKTLSKLNEIQQIVAELKK